MKIPRWRQKQMRDRLMRLAQIHRAGEKSRRLERERREWLQADTTAILSNRAPQLRKRQR